jgi:hypothetical protein
MGTAVDFFSLTPLLYDLKDKEVIVEKRAVAQWKRFGTGM